MSLAQSGFPFGKADCMNIFDAISARDGDGLELMRREGVDPDARNGAGVGAASLAAALGLVDILRILRRHGADLTALDGDGRSPASRAAEQGRSDCLEFLLDHGADSNTLDAQGNSLAVLAASCDRHEVKKNVVCLDVLAQRGADVSRAGDLGITPAMWACALGDLPALRLLASHGADFSLRNHQGASAIDLARDECAAFVQAAICQRELEAAVDHAETSRPPRL